MLWRVEYRKHLPYFAMVIAVTAGLGIASAIAPDVEVFSVLLTMSTLVTWTATIVYTSACTLRFLTLGDDLLLHVSSLSPWRLVTVKALVLGSYMAMQCAATVMAQSPHISEVVGPESGRVFTYLVAAKLVSIACFLISVVFAAAVAKTIRQRGPATALFVVALMILVAAQAIVLWHLGAPETQFFFIGVGGDFTTVNLYANVLPLVLTGPGEGFLPPVAGLSMLLNAAVAVAIALVTAGLVRWRRFDHTEL